MNLCRKYGYKINLSLKMFFSTTKIIIIKNQKDADKRPNKAVHLHTIVIDTTTTR